MPLRDIAEGVLTTIGSAARGILRRPPRPGDRDFVPWLIRLAIIALVIVAVIWLVSAVARAFLVLVVGGIAVLVVLIVLSALFGS